MTLFVLDIATPVLLTLSFPHPAPARPTGLEGREAFSAVQLLEAGRRNDKFYQASLPL
jgi:hypothetical protein